MNVDRNLIIISACGLYIYILVTRIDGVRLSQTSTASDNHHTHTISGCGGKHRVLGAGRSGEQNF